MHPTIVVLAYKRIARVVREVIAEGEWEASFDVWDSVLEESPAWQWKLRDADAVVSSGANAAILAGALEDLPLVTVRVTGFDVMEAIRKGMERGREIVLMTHRYSPPQLEECRDIFRCPVESITFNDASDAEEKIRALIADRNPAIIGGSLVNDLTKRAGGEAIFLYSRESVRLALETAVEMAVQRKAERRKRETLTTILQTVPEGILHVDEAGRVTELNTQARKLLGVPVAESVTGRPVDERFPDLRMGEVLTSGNEAARVFRNGNGHNLVADLRPVIGEKGRTGVIAVIQDARRIQRTEIKVRRRVHEQGLRAKARFSRILTRSERMRRILEKAERYAGTDGAVLIRGETGTGKELVAQSLHNAGSRKGSPFVAVNCAALPVQLLESELFGYEEGAFTGARKGGKRGLFELAHTGTVFLDEIGDMPAPLQARLLRVLQEKEVMPVGGDRIVPVDVRVVSATHRDLEGMVERGEFRRDLYYRLNVLPLVLPPLRERMEDIPLLVGEFLSREGWNRQRIDAELPRILSILAKHDWPGNIRELENVVQRIVHLSRAEGGVARIVEEIAEEWGGSADPETGLEAERLSWEGGRILHVLKETRGNRAAAARKLGVSRSTLWRKLKALGIETEG